MKKEVTKFLAEKLMEMGDVIPEALKMKLVEAILRERYGQNPDMPKFEGRKRGPPGPMNGGRNYLDFLKRVFPTMAKTFGCDAINPESEEFKSKMENFLSSIAMKMI